MFSSLKTTYSLVLVVADQLQMLLNHNIPVKLIVSEHCPDDARFGIFLDERIEWVKIKSSINDKPIKLYDYFNPNSVLHESFNEETEMFAKEFENALSDVSTCIMHDILYQGAHYVHNIAIRKAQKKLQNVRFLAFTHSIPSKRPLVVRNDVYGRYTPMENTLYIYPSYSGIPALAKQYNVPESSCRVVNNCAPVLSSLSDDVKKLHSMTPLLNTDYMIVYPARLSTGKKLEKVAALAGCIKQVSGKSVKVVFCDFTCSNTPPDEYKAAIRYVGDFYGLSDDDIVFTSDYGYSNGFPRDGVLDLFLLSNMFICPSLSESFSLTMLEAASRGNFLVINECVPALREIGELLGAYFVKWDAMVFDTLKKQKYTPSEKIYYQTHSVKIIRRMEDDQTCHAKSMIRRRFNPDWVWENQLKDLII